MTALLNIFTPINLKPWTMPGSYIGPSHEGYYYFLGQNRDSDLLTQSNFICGLELLGGETDTVQVIRDGHWACGWIEYILIHESDIKSLQVADAIMTNLNDYPVLDESHYSDMEYRSYSEYADQEKDTLALFLCLVFGLPESMASEQDMLNLAFQLNLEAQLQGGEYSAFTYNEYHVDFESAWSQLENYLPDLEHMQGNHAYDLVCACMGLA
jgi:hypothetical protein